MNWEKLFESPIPIVQEKKKYANFTITEIGGPLEIIKWREQQAAKEYVQRMRLGARDDRLTAFEELTEQKLATPKISQANWDEKLDFAMSERKRLAKLDERVQDNPPWLPTPEPKKSVIQRITGFFKNIWSDAQF
jgi:hypothetical protein